MTAMAATLTRSAAALPSAPIAQRGWQRQQGDAVCLSCRMQRHARPRPAASAQNRPQRPLKSADFFPALPSDGLRSRASQRRSRPCRAAYVSAPVAEPHEGPSEEARLAAADPTAGFATPKSLEEPLVTWQLVARLIGQHKLRVAAAALAVAGGTVCTLSMPQFSGKFFETLVGIRPGPLSDLLWKLGLLYAVEPLATVVYITSMTTMWEKVTASLRSHVYSRLLMQKVEFFDRFRVSELTNLVTTELAALRSVVLDNVSRDRGFRSVSEVLGTFVILFRLAPRLAPVLAILITSVSIGAAIYKRTTTPAFKDFGVSQGRLGEAASETFSAIRTVRSFGGERRQIRQFDEQVSGSRGAGERLGVAKSLNESWTRIAIYVSLFVLYVVGGAEVKAGRLPVGTMVAFIGYTFTLTFAVQGLVNTLADIRTALAAVERINNVGRQGRPDAALAVGLDREARGELRDCGDRRKDIGVPEVLPAVLGTDGRAAASTNGVSVRGACEAAWSGDVRLEDVHFTYPQRPEAAVLKGVTLTLVRGTVTALVGESGAGKSTVVQLLARFYEPTGGRITLAGTDVRSFDKSEWAQAVSLVAQEPVLFAMSVAENIAYGAPNKTVPHDEIVRAAKAANAHNFIMGLPDGYDTLVGERGSLLSGGQRQRVAIARALVKNSPILVLDEATSALDSVSERLVQDAIDNLVKGRTTLVIAHRLSTVQSADQIVVMADGEVAEQGTHAELTERGGRYARLVASQRLSFST
ncbi:ABC transporter [Klebsormidium nitens]|uniref:ABC transporter n=1 Tax=Klebsormidium nitens TaxID=105231 RepID=A0A1Y1I6T6_KLENI|nr:ABC transporter [Klebsormidium nitens]|eukprot:GAQ86233.1 ABC transporter [Klebsormidium nitens]